MGVFLSGFYSRFYLDVRGCNVQAGDEGASSDGKGVPGDRRQIG